MTLLTRWEPLREFSTMQDHMNRMDRVFRESYSPEGPEEALTTTTFVPPVDTYEDGHNIVLKLEVPGIDEKDMHVHIDNNTLTVHGERNIEEEKEENYRRIERQYGSFTRSFTLPSSVDQGQVSAHYDKGVLKINLAKKAEAKPKQIKVNVRGEKDARSQGSRQGLREMGGGFRFGVPLCGSLICSEDERLALQAAFISSVCKKEGTHHEYWYLQISGQQILESALQSCAL